MNQESRQKVLDWCAFQDTYPLYFNGYESIKDEFNPDKYTVEDMIRRVLTLAKDYASYDSNTDDYEASSDRWRSALDIWRHIIYYYPTVEIFDVMRGLYNIKDECGGQFCSTVERRTFKLKKAYIYSSSGWGNYQAGERDEFGLNWRDWENI